MRRESEQRKIDRTPTCPALIMYAPTYGRDYASGWDSIVTSTHTRLVQQHTSQSFRHPLCSQTTVHVQCHLPHQCLHLSFQSFLSGL
uniref:Uncharacterized protein n=1 Tax=Arion vulgaris TaxID=1028688 RepID=A0A0B7B3X9_9EUPU